MERKGKRTSKRRKQRKAREKDCDRVFSLLIRTRDDWQCKACGSTYRPQCAHIVSRRYRAVRWTEENAVCLCSGCHIKFTYDPLAWEAWVDERYPGRLAYLKPVALAGVRAVDYDFRLDSLKEQLAVLKRERGIH